MKDIETLKQEAKEDKEFCTIKTKKLKGLLNEIDRLTTYSRKLLDENIAFANETNRLKARAEKAETEVKFNKSKLRYAADLLLKDKQEYITLAKDHYWDSMENNKDVIIKHIEAIWELWERQED